MSPGSSDGRRSAIVLSTTAAGAFAFSYAQRSLSTPARTLRRRVDRVEGSLTLETGATQALDRAALLAPPRESAPTPSTVRVVLLPTAVLVLVLVKRPESSARPICQTYEAGEASAAMRAAMLTSA